MGDGKRDNERAMREALDVLLAEQDAKCPECGYTLHPTGSDRCPECGVHLKLRLQESCIDCSWLVLIISLGMLAGQGLHRWIALAVQDDLLAILDRFTIWWYWGAVDCLIMLAPVALVFAVKYRRRFEARTSRVRWTLAVLPGVVFLIELGWILVVNW